MLGRQARFDQAWTLLPNSDTSHNGAFECFEVKVGENDVTSSRAVKPGGNQNCSGKYSKMPFLAAGCGVIGVDRYLKYLRSGGFWPWRAGINKPSGLSL